MAFRCVRLYTGPRALQRNARRRARKTAPPGTASGRSPVRHSEPAGHTSGTVQPVRHTPSGAAQRGNQHPPGAGRVTHRVRRGARPPPGSANVSARQPYAPPGTAHAAGQTPADRGAANKKGAGPGPAVHLFTCSLTKPWHALCPASTPRVSYLFTLHSPLPVPFTDPRFTAAEKGIRRSGVCPLYVPFCSGRGAQARPGVSSLKGLFT